MRFRRSIAATFLLFTAVGLTAAEAEWPQFKNAEPNKPVTLKSPAFLEIPEAVKKDLEKPGAVPIEVAKTPPTVTLAMYGNLGPEAKGRRLWSTWGDICLARDGRVYAAIGDHNHDMEGDARCFIYCWDPKAKTLTQVVDMNKVTPPEPGRPSWSKVHAKIDEGIDGKIYFSCTLNDGNKAAVGKWTEKVPGGQVYRYDPATGKTDTLTSLPPKCCTATSLYDAKRNIWYCNLEHGGTNALYGLDLATGKTVFQAPEGSIGFNRAIAMANDGTLFFNGGERGKKAPQPETPAAVKDVKPTEKAADTKSADAKGSKDAKDAKRAKRPPQPSKAELAAAAAKMVTPLMKYDPETKTITKTATEFKGSPGIRSASRESKDGQIYGVTQGTGEIYRYSVKDDKLTLLGKAWMTGAYVTVVALSPDDKYLYYLPGAHGQSYVHGTPVMQYEIATGKRKVLAFLIPPFEKEHGYAPGGTYGIKISADGSTLYVDFNGNGVEGLQPANSKTKGFGITSFAAIEIPASER